MAHSAVLLDRANGGTGKNTEFNFSICMHFVGLCIFSSKICFPLQNKILSSLRAY